MTTKTFDTPHAKARNEVYPTLSQQRLRQILKVVERRFAASRSGTAAIGLAKAAGISEFQEVIKRNSQDRLAALRERFMSIPDLPPLECVASMAEATVLACVERIGNASVLAWGLMKMPEFAAEVYRAEIGATEALWNAEIGTRSGDSLVRSRLAVHLVPYAVHACMAFGFWLAALRHKPATAQAHACQYAGGIVSAARAVLPPAEWAEAPASARPAKREFVR